MTSPLVNFILKVPADARLVLGSKTLRELVEYIVTQGAPNHFCSDTAFSTVYRHKYTRHTNILGLKIGTLLDESNIKQVYQVVVGLGTYLLTYAGRNIPLSVL